MISSLGYLRIESADVTAWREFGLKILGMTEGRGPEAEAVYLRMDEFPARLAIIPGSSDRLLASGWEVRDAQALAAVGRRGHGHLATRSPLQHDHRQPRFFFEFRVGQVVFVTKGRGVDFPEGAAAGVFGKLVEGFES